MIYKSINLRSFRCQGVFFRSSHRQLPWSLVAVLFIGIALLILLWLCLPLLLLIQRQVLIFFRKCIKIQGLLGNVVLILAFDSGLYLNINDGMNDFLSYLICILPICAWNGETHKCCFWWRWSSSRDTYFCMICSTIVRKSRFVIARTILPFWCGIYRIHIPTISSCSYWWMNIFLYLNRGPRQWGFLL